MLPISILLFQLKKTPLIVSYKAGLGMMNFSVSFCYSGKLSYTSIPNFAEESSLLEDFFSSSTLNLSHHPSGLQFLLKNLQIIFNLMGLPLYTYKGVVLLLLLLRVFLVFNFFFTFFPPSFYLNSNLKSNIYSESE